MKDYDRNNWPKALKEAAKLCKIDKTDVYAITIGDTMLVMPKVDYSGMVEESKNSSNFSYLTHAIFSFSNAEYPVDYQISMAKCDAKTIYHNSIWHVIKPEKEYIEVATKALKNNPKLRSLYRSYDKRITECDLSAKINLKTKHLVRNSEGEIIRCSDRYFKRNKELVSIYKTKVYTK